MYQIVHHGSVIHAYEHPYLLTRSRDRKTFYVWSCSTSADIPTHVSALNVEYEDEDIMLEPHIFSDKFLLLHHGFRSDVRVLLIHRIVDGSLCDQKNITYDSNPNDLTHSPLPGDSAFLDAAEGLIAIFVNGSGPGDSAIEIYGISDEGKFVLKNRLEQPVDAPALLERVNDKTYAPTGYILPTVIHFTEDYFIGAFGGHNVELVKWHSPSSQPSNSRTDLPPVRFLDDLPWSTMESSLCDKVYVHSLNSIFLAHYEFPINFVDQEPITTVRSVDVETPELNWCTPIGHKTGRLRYSKSSNVLISFEDGPYGVPSDTQRDTSIYVLDASTGAVRRHDRVSVLCETSPSGEEIVTTQADGRAMVIPVAAFLEHGFPAEAATQGDDSGVQTQASLGALLQSAAFYPELEPETPPNSKRRAAERKAAAKYTELGQPRPWVDVLFVGDVFILLGSRGRLGFVVIKWK